MATKPAVKGVKEFMKNAKEVICPRCGQDYMTVENFKECYVCGADMKTGIVYN